VWKRKYLGTQTIWNIATWKHRYSTHFYSEHCYSEHCYSEHLTLCTGEAPLRLRAVCLLAVRLAAICIGIEAEGEFVENPDSAGRSQPILGL
jgi:hypothetical protein